MADDAPKPRRFIGRRAAAQQAAAAGVPASGSEVVPAKAATKRFVKQQVPDDILHDEALNEAIAVLPANYSFEIHKTVARVRQLAAKRVALQFPEGLLMYACVIADILETHGGVEHAFVMGDVTYGACCVDDFSAKALGADLLVHYGHSCLVPVDVTKVPCMYVFVDIRVDVRHLAATVVANFPAGANLVLAGTIQFGSSIQAARQQLAGSFPSLRIPQAKPLSPGEVLGCTAPVVPPETDAVVFVADGRFHLEAIMIANPAIPAFRYDPYAREMTAEAYDQAGMRAVRRAMVEAAAPARQWGVVLGTLGRQGNPRLVRHLCGVLERRGRRCLTVLLSEVMPAKLAQIGGIEAWVQVACPRLSIDWGEAFTTPTLTPFEALVALGEVPPWWALAASPAPAEEPAVAAAATDGGTQPAPELRGAAGTPASAAAESDPGASAQHSAAQRLAGLRLSGEPGGQARQPPLDSLHRAPPDAPPPEPPAAASPPAAPAAGLAAAGTQPALSRNSGAGAVAERHSSPAAQADAPSAQPAGRPAGAGPGAARGGDPGAAGLAGTEQQRADARAGRQRFDAYPMDYYARDGGAWNSYYAPPQQQGSAGKLAALRAVRATAPQPAQTAVET